MSRRFLACVLGVGLALALSFGADVPSAVRAAGPEWAANVTVIEACSCPMFCQCYFNPKPASHGGHEGHAGKHFCKANNAYKVNTGHHGATKLDGAKFWIATDLGDDFADGEMEWASTSTRP